MNSRAAVIATAALAALSWLAVACSSSPSSAGGSPKAGGTASSRSAVSFSGCMRSHGLASYPDPGSNGVLPKTSPQQLGVSSSRFQTAQQACQHLLPDTGTALTARSMQQCYLAYVCPPTLVQQALTAGLQLARCMRSHGVSDWPDPSVDPQGRPLFDINVPRPTPPQVRRALNLCGRLHPAGSQLAWG
jgi:hypothetical protein